MYPYISTQVCQNCESAIVVKQKRDKDNQFCSKECYNQYRRRGKPIKLNLSSKYICLKCGNPFHPTRNTKGMYCSYNCSNGAKSVRHKLVCKCCGKKFEINNIAEIKRGHYQYCSNECRKRKYNINEKYFEEINSETSYWIGFIWATLKENKYKSLSLISKKDSLEMFNQSLQSNYPIRKKGTKFILKINSLKILSDLVEFGIKDPNFLEFPEIPTKYQNDFIRGYFDSDWGFNYKDNGKDVAVLHGRSSKLMLSISEILNSKLVYNNGEWVTISFDFVEKINGHPKNEIKWSKFNL